MKSYSKFTLILSELLLLLAFTQTTAFAQANLILFNGRVWTENEKAPWAEAVAVKENKILAVGKNAQIKKLASKYSKIIDLGGRLLIPGFNDAHTHFLGGSLDLTEVSLTGARSLELMQQRVKDFAEQHPNDPWITGAGWEYASFPNQQLPTRSQLDAVVADRPVYLRAYDGHTGWVNTKTLQLAGITKDSKFEGFGEIVRDANGEPTGVLKEGAQGLVRKFVPEPSREKKLNALRQGMKLAASLGITSFQNASGSPEELALYEELLQRGELSIRASIAFSVAQKLSDDSLAKMVALKEKYKSNPMLRAAAVKFVLDGVIESHTAAMIDPYSDAPTLRGTPSHKADIYNDLVAKCSKTGFQIYTHAIGDRAVQMALDAYEKIQSGSKNPDLRSRVEHIETVSAIDLLRFGKLGVLASMEPIHADPDTIDVWSKAVGTERIKRAFPWNELSKSGAKLVFSSDWPATISVDPMRGLHNAVNRKTTEGNPVGGWIPEQRVTIQQAVEAYTSVGAFASFEEKIKGKIVPGMLADFAVLSANFFAIDPLKIHETKVVTTVFDGKIIFQDEKLFPVGKRDLSDYEIIGPLIASSGISPALIHQRVNEFIWNHWQNKRRGYAVVTFYSKEGDASTSYIYIEPDENDNWVLDVAIERKMPDRRGYSDPKYHGKIIEETDNYIGYRVEKINSKTNSFDLRIKDKAGRLLIMVFEKIIRQNVEQTVSLFKQTNSLFYAFASKFFVGFNFQRPLLIIFGTNFSCHFYTRRIYDFYNFSSQRQ